MDGSVVLLNDPETDSHMYIIPKQNIRDLWCIDEDNITSNLNKLNWQKVYGKKQLLRSSCWYTKSKCSCKYAYADQSYEANDFPPWMQVLASKLTDKLGMKSKPLNSCNCNLYEDGSQALYFHADNEKLFQTHDGKVNIVSLSFGASRDFLVKRNYETDNLAKRHTLSNGDILVMGGKMQLYWQHAVDKAPPLKAGDPGPAWRINLTFRHISQPASKCKLCN